MVLKPIDWTIIASFFVFSLFIGVLVSKRAGKSSSEFFLSGRHMPWWLLGVSMVATTFSSDTPNLVTDIVRRNGVAGNWVWWAFLLTGMLTVFVYAKLWRRSGVMTDIEFYELRYSGKSAAFLRGFRALYLGIFFNVLIMAAVSLAAIKIGAVMLNLSPVTTLIIASVVVVIYSALGGLTGILITDFFMFGVAMFGSIMAAKTVLGLPEVGGLSNLLASPQLADKIQILPDFTDSSLLIPLFIMPLAVQWWSVWYPGSEPGGGGYVAQRMLSAKNEKNAMGATLFFNVAHYALRPWPWIIVALCSILVFPTIESLQDAFPHISAHVVRDDLAYPAMLTFLPAGLLGLVIASLIAAFMSTISTHLNWGSSYIVNDFYKRFVNPNANERKLVSVGRLSTVLLMVIAGLFALTLQNALQAFEILLQVGAGTGLLFILRWFWWRINSYSELTAMIVSFLMAVFFFLGKRFEFIVMPHYIELVVGVGVTTIAWIAVTFLTKPADEETLIKFYRKVHPGGPGWRAVIDRAKAKGIAVSDPMHQWDVPTGILCMVFGCLAVYSALFATGYWIYSNVMPAAVLTATAVISTVILVKLWSRLDILQPESEITDRPIKEKQLV